MVIQRELPASDTRHQMARSHNQLTCVTIKEPTIPVSAVLAQELDQALRRRFPTNTACQSERRSPNCAENPCRTSWSRPDLAPSPTDIRIKLRLHSFELLLRWICCKIVVDLLHNNSLNHKSTTMQNKLKQVESSLNLTVYTCFVCPDSLWQVYGINYSFALCLSVCLSVCLSILFVCHYLTNQRVRKHTQLLYFYNTCKQVFANL